MISSTRRSASGRTCEVGLLRRLRRLLHLLGDVLCLPGPFLGAIRDRLGVRLLLRLLVGLDVVLLDLLIFDFDRQRLGGPPRFLLRDEVVDGARFFRVGVVVRVLPSTGVPSHAIPDGDLSGRFCAQWVVWPTSPHHTCPSRRSSS
jgi:hypothetical protein